MDRMLERSTGTLSVRGASKFAPNGSETNAAPVHCSIVYAAYCFISFLPGRSAAARSDLGVGQDGG